MLFFASVTENASNPNLLAATVPGSVANTNYQNFVHGRSLIFRCCLIFMFSASRYGTHCTYFFTTLTATNNLTLDLVSKTSTEMLIRVKMSLQVKYIGLPVVWSIGLRYLFRHC
jgi:hypothetical protein